MSHTRQARRATWFNGCGGLFDVKLGVTKEMSTVSFLWVFGAIAAGAWVLVTAGRLPKPYRARACQSRAWREAFPSATKQEIRDFLSLFVGAFAWSEKEQLKLAPTDRILQIYRARYPLSQLPDGMELEMLALDLERRHGLRLEVLWSDCLTLGELFSQTQIRRHAAT